MKQPAYRCSVLAVGLLLLTIGEWPAFGQGSYMDPEEAAKLAEADRDHAGAMERANAELAAAMDRALAKIDASFPDEVRTAAKATLVDAHARWLAFRHTDCRSENVALFLAARWAPARLADCMVRAAEARTSELKSRYFLPE